MVHRSQRPDRSGVIDSPPATRTFPRSRLGMPHCENERKYACQRSLNQAAAVPLNMSSRSAWENPATIS